MVVADVSVGYSVLFGRADALSLPDDAAAADPEHQRIVDDKTLDRAGHRGRILGWIFFTLRAIAEAARHNVHRKARTFKRNFRIEITVGSVSTSFAYSVAYFFHSLSVIFHYAR